MKKTLFLVCALLTWLLPGSAMAGGEETQTGFNAGAMWAVFSAGLVVGGMVVGVVQSLRRPS